MPDTETGDDRPHTHTWTREGGDCACGAPVPSWLLAAWEIHAEKTAGE